MRRIGLATAVTIVAAAALWWTAGTVAIHPRHRVVPHPGFEVDTVAISSEDGIVRGWTHGDTSKGACVLLLHGVVSDRRQLAHRMPVFAAWGYSTLAIDLPAHGESDGDALTFGYREKEGVRAATRWLRSNGCPGGVVVDGFSLGAASALLLGEELDADAVIVEASFATFDEASARRLSMVVGPLGPLASWALTRQMPWRLGFDTDDLRPIDGASRIDMPALVIGGADDPRAHAGETRALANAFAGPVDVWLVEGMSHQDVAVVAPEAWRERVRPWLDRALER